MIVAHQIVQHLLEDDEGDEVADWKEIEPLSIQPWLEQSGFVKTGDQWVLKASRFTTLTAAEIPGTDKWDVKIFIHGKLKDNAHFTDSEMRQWLVNGGYVKPRGIREDQERITDALFEPGQITLEDLFLENQPEQWVEDMFSAADLKIPLPIREVDPEALLLHGKPVATVVKAAKAGPTWKIVQHYLKHSGDAVLLNGQEVLDGQHRVMAAFLAKRLVRAVNATDLPVREAEEDDDEGAWKEVSPDVAAADVQRWVFTDYELKRYPQVARASDEFYVGVEGCDLEVIIRRDGTVTNRWGDGTYGVPEHIRELADQEEVVWKPRRARQNDTDDYHADNWRDVYVDRDGNFMGFVDSQKDRQR